MVGGNLSGQNEKSTLHNHDVRNLTRKNVHERWELTPLGKLQSLIVILISESVTIES